MTAKCLSDLWSLWSLQMRLSYFNHFLSRHMFAFYPVLLIPVQPQLISVCLEEDEDLRVDCRIEPKPNKINSYEFSWSSGAREALINTNVSGSAAEAQFRDKSEVVELEPHGYRMTLKGFTNTLPHNTTYMCKITGQVESINVEKGGWFSYLRMCGLALKATLILFRSPAEQLQPCSAVSLFLKSSWSWIVPLLIFLFQTHC